MSKRAHRDKIAELNNLVDRAIAERDTATDRRNDECDRADRAEAKLAAVADLHQPKFAYRRVANPEAVAHSFEVGDGLLMCEQCVQAWPCKTYQTLAGVPSGRVLFVADK